MCLTRAAVRWQPLQAYQGFAGLQVCSRMRFIHPGDQRSRAEKVFEWMGRPITQWSRQEIALVIDKLSVESDSCESPAKVLRGLQTQVLRLERIVSLSGISLEALYFLYERDP